MYESVSECTGKGRQRLMSSHKTGLEAGRNVRLGNDISPSVFGHRNFPLVDLLRYEVTLLVNVLGSLD